MSYTEEDVRRYVKYPATGIWYVIVPGTDGRWKSSGKKTEHAAVEWALAATREGGLQSKTVLRDFARVFYLPGKCTFITSREADGSGRRTAKHWRDMRQVVDDYLLPRWGAWFMETVPPDEFHEWLLGLVSTKTKKPLSGRMKKRIRDAALDIWDWAVFRRKVRFNQLRS